MVGKGVGSVVCRRQVAWHRDTRRKHVGQAVAGTTEGNRRGREGEGQKG